MEIDAHNYRDALPLLTEGFEDTTAAFWEDGIKRLLASPAHADGGEPIGHFIIADDEPIGLALLTASKRCGADGKETQRIVNFSAWYLKTEQRWRLPQLLNKCMADPNAVYTDLTPAPHVVPILEALGFKQFNQGVELINGPVAAATPIAPGRLSPWRDSPLADRSPQQRRLFEDHENLGCYVWALEIDGAVTPLIMKAIVKARLPLANVIYCEDTGLLDRAIPVVARAMLSRGRLGLIIDAPLDRAPRTTISRIGLPNRFPRFMKNGAASRGTDYAYSELVFFDQ